MTQKLISVAREQWALFDGWSVSRGIDPLDLPLDRYCSFVYYWVMSNMDEEEAEKFESKLWMPPKGEAAPEQGPWSPESETAAFGELQSQIGTK